MLEGGEVDTCPGSIILPFAKGSGKRLQGATLRTRLLLAQVHLGSINLMEAILSFVSGHRCPAGYQTLEVG